MYTGKIKKTYVLTLNSQHLLVVVDVTDYDRQQADNQHDGCGVDNRVKGVKAVRVVPGPVKILLDTSTSQDYICKCISTPHHLGSSSCSGKCAESVEDGWEDPITNRFNANGSWFMSKIWRKLHIKSIRRWEKWRFKSSPEILNNYMTRGWWEHWNPVIIQHILIVTYGCKLSKVTLFLPHRASLSHIHLVTESFFKHNYHPTCIYIIKLIYKLINCSLF